MKPIKTLLAACTALASLSASMPGHADSVTVTPAATGSTALDHVNVTVVIPNVMFFRVGTGSATVGGANVNTVDGMHFNVPATALGDSTQIAALAGDGDQTNGAVTVRVYSNVGTNATINSSIAGGLSDGAGDTIPYSSQILVTASALGATTPGFTNAAITHPAFAATSGNGTATTLTAASKLIRQECKWTYAYANSVSVPGGTYGSTVANNGQITYTLTQL